MLTGSHVPNVSLLQERNKIMRISFISYASQEYPLLQEFFFSSVFEIKCKIGCYRLLTHRRGTHRKFFYSSLLI